MLREAAAEHSRYSSRWTIPRQSMDVDPIDKIDDIVRRSVGCGKQCVHAICEGRMLRKNDEMKSCGVRDGSTVKIASRLRGGGKHKDNKSKSKKKQAANPKKSELSQRQQEENCEEEPKSDSGSTTQEIDKETVILMMEENEGIRKIIECVGEGSDGELEDKIQWYLMKAQESGAVDKGQKREKEEVEREHEPQDRNK